MERDEGREKERERERESKKERIAMSLCERAKSLCCSGRLAPSGVDEEEHHFEQAAAVIGWASEFPDPCSRCCS